MTASQHREQGSKILHLNFFPKHSLYVNLWVHFYAKLLIKVQKKSARDSKITGLQPFFVLNLLIYND